MPGPTILLYGVMLREAIASADLETMRAFATVSSSMLENSGDLEAADLEEWKAAHQELLSAIAESASIELASEDIVAIRDGIVVIDNNEFARSLKPLLNADLEPRLTITISW